jgi:hypothetical protein
MRFWNGRLRRDKQVIRDAIWNALQERASQTMPEYCRPMKTGRGCVGLGTRTSLDETWFEQRLWSAVRQHRFGTSRVIFEFERDTPLASGKKRR